VASFFLALPLSFAVFPICVRVSKRVKDGWELHEAMDAPEGMRLSEYREKKTIERLEQARLERNLLNVSEEH
jgi:hypothetical protein